MNEGDRKCGLKKGKYTFVAGNLHITSFYCLLQMVACTSAHTIPSLFFTFSSFFHLSPTSPSLSPFLSPSLPPSSHLLLPISSFSKVQDQQLWLSHQTADSLQSVSMGMEAKEKQAATEHTQLVTRFSSALERERKESQEEQERVRNLLQTQLSNFEKVRGRLEYEGSEAASCCLQYGNLARAWERG